MNRDSLLLYAVTDRAWLRGDTLAAAVRKALDGGATFVQLREKDASFEQYRGTGLEIKALCREYSVPFVINDNIKIAAEIDADGAHIGQSDMSVSEARSILGKSKILGVSAQTVRQAISAQNSGADYLGVGAVFPTGTKSDADAVSLETLREICAAVSIPVIAIGGISEYNIDKLKGSGIAGVAVVSAIFASDDITAAASALKRKAKEIL